MGAVSDLKFTLITHQCLRRGAVLTRNALISRPWKITVRKRALRSFKYRLLSVNLPWRVRTQYRLLSVYLPWRVCTQYRLLSVYLQSLHIMRASRPPLACLYTVSPPFCLPPITTHNESFQASPGKFVHWKRSNTGGC